MEQQENSEISYYLPRHEFYEKRIEMLKYVDEGDKRSEEKYDQLNLILQTFIESQKPLQESMPKVLDELKVMNTNMTAHSQRTDKLEDEQIKIKDSIKEIKEESKQKVSDRNKLIIGVVTAFAGGGGLIPVLAQIFFQ